MTWGVNDATGYTGYNVGTNLADDPILMLADAYAPTNRRAIAFRLFSYDAIVAYSNVTLGIYDVTDGADAATLVYSQVCAMPPVAELTWIQYNFPAPVNLTNGRTYARAFVLDNLGGNSWIGRIAASGFSLRFFSSAGNGVLPDPFGAGSSSYAYQFAMEVITEAIVPEFDPENTDTELLNTGGYSARVQNLGGAVPVSLELVNTTSGTIVTTQVDFDYTATDANIGVINFTATRGNLPYGGLNTVLRCTLDSAATFSIGAEILPEPGKSYVKAVDPVNDETSAITEWLSAPETPAIGDAATGDQLVVVSITDIIYTDVYPDFTMDQQLIFGEIDFPDSIAVNFEYYKASTATWYSFTKTTYFSEGGGEPGTPTIETVGTVRIGGATAITVSGFSGPITSGTVDGAALVSADDDEIVLPALVDTEESPRPGMRDITLTDGTDSDTVSRPVGAPDGWSYYTITAEFIEAINGVTKDYLPDGAAVDDFILYPSPKNNVSDNGIGTSFVGTQEFFHLDNATNIATAFDVTTGAGAAAFGGSASGTNKMHAVKMTARKMGN